MGGRKATCSIRRRRRTRLRSVRSTLGEELCAEMRTRARNGMPGLSLVQVWRALSTWTCGTGKTPSSAELARQAGSSHEAMQRFHALPLDRTAVAGKRQSAGQDKSLMRQVRSAPAVWVPPAWRSTMFATAMSTESMR